MVLQVPFVQQSELLCGGAAIAMLERWWGRRGVDAEAFAPLVRPALGGITTGDLVAATRARGWLTSEVRGTIDLVRQALRDSVPVVALIAVSPTRYHYVVIVGWSDDRVVFHDPAVGPFVNRSTVAFLRQWSATDQWALLVRPSPVTESPIAAMSVQAPPPTDSLPCRPWLDQAAAAASDHHLAAADRALALARVSCPTEALVDRELAGIRFRQGRQAEAGLLVSDYLRRAPGDSLAWQLLASSRYLEGRRGEALDAWNVIGRPLVDLVHIDGSHHVRFGVLTGALGLPVGTVLTRERLALANRRIDDVPALSRTRVTYVAVPGGLVEVRAAVVEHPVVAPLPMLLLTTAVRAFTRQDVAVPVASPFGAGERWVAQWRWEAADPRRAVRLDIPARVVIPGVVNVGGSWEGFHVGNGDQAVSASREERRTTTLGFTGWATAHAEALVGLRLEAWTRGDRALAVTLGTARHWLDDRAVVAVVGEQALPLGRGTGYARISVSLAWRSPVAAHRLDWSGRLGGDWASVRTPLGLRPMAGGDPARRIPLRAHPLIRSDLLVARQAGRGVIHGGFAVDRHIADVDRLTLAVGLFLDGAQVMLPADGSSRSTRFLDAGIGVRVGAIGNTGMALRLDLARGLLEDRRWALSAGLQQPWPPRLRPLP